MIARRQEGNRVAFQCPGCGDVHSLPVGPGGWIWNGSLEAPTFSPSILARGGHYVPGHAGECWCTYNQTHPDLPSGFKCGVCHSFVTDGKIQFCVDSTHALVGQTVAIPEWI
jgi:hypothetical protein